MSHVPAGDPIDLSGESESSHDKSQKRNSTEEQRWSWGRRDWKWRNDHVVLSREKRLVGVRPKVWINSDMVWIQMDILQLNSRTGKEIEQFYQIYMDDKSKLEENRRNQRESENTEDEGMDYLRYGRNTRFIVRSRWSVCYKLSMIRRWPTWNSGLIRCGNADSGIPLHYRFRIYAAVSEERSECEKNSTEWPDFDNFNI